MKNVKYLTTHIPILYIYNPLQLHHLNHIVILSVLMIVNNQPIKRTID